jgi:uncharacterized repeat protein (TIGR01451 family)
VIDSGDDYTWAVPAGWTIISGQGTNSITVTVGTAGGTISVTPSNECGNGPARTLAVTVAPLPGPPTSASSNPGEVCAGVVGNITLTASGGSGTTLQWFAGSCGGTPIGTGSPLTIAAPLVTTTYYARWQNICGVSGCATTTVTVLEQPEDPDEVTVDRNDFCADDAGNITLTASGGSGTTIKWFAGSCGGTEIGSGNPLTIPSPSLSTTYFARWENICGVSGCAQVTVNVLPLPTAPASASVNREGFCYDDDGDILLTASGGSGDELVWFEGSCGGTQIGAGSPFTIASPPVTTTYFAAWVNTCGTSSCASVTVIVNLVGPGAIAADQTICYSGNPAAFTSTAAGTGLGTIYYRWESAVSPFTVWNVIGGATAATYDPPGGLVETTKYRRVTISDYNDELCESAPTSALTVTVQSQLTAGEIGYDQSICFNGDTDPFVNLESGTGSGTITYRWEKSVNPFTVWTNIAGATEATYDPGLLVITTAFRRFTVSTLNGVACESISTNWVTVYVQEIAVTAGSIGYSQTICHGGTPDPLVSVVAGTGSPSAIITYEWQFSIDNGVTWNTVPDEYGPGLVLPALYQNTMYRRRTIATLEGNACPSQWTIAVTISVMSNVTPGSIAASQTICNGNTPAPLISVQNGFCPEGTITYFWEQSTNDGATWTLIPGAILAAYPPPALTVTTWYRRTTVATSASGHQCFSVPTNVVIITVHAVVEPGIIAEAQTICYGATPAPLYSVVPGSGSSAPAYSWEFSINDGATWSLILGANGSGYGPGALTQTTWYRRITTCTLNGVSCSATSLPVIITVQGLVVPPVVTAAPPTTICYNTAPGLLTRTNASGGSGLFTYQWQTSTDLATWAPIPGETGLTYQPPNLMVTTYFRVQTYDSECGGPFYSNVITITVYAELVAPEICCDQTICVYNTPDPITIIIPVSGGSGNYSYQWQRSLDEGVTWNDITGEIGPTYNPPTITTTTTRTLYRLRVTDNYCLNYQLSNEVLIVPGNDIGITFLSSGNPTSPVCPGYSFEYRIWALSPPWSILRYSWQGDPAYVTSTVPAGQPIGTTYLWIFTRGVFPFTMHNTTDAIVTTTISITPSLYDPPGPPSGALQCSLESETFNVTIYPFKIACPEDIEQVTDPGYCIAQVAIPNIVWVPNSCTSTVYWNMSGATTGAGSGNMGTRTFNLGTTTITYSSTLNGINTSCSFNVIVSDDQPPILTCPGDIYETTAAGECATEITTPAPTYIDNCTGPVGVVLLTWEMTGATVASSPSTGINYVGTYTFEPGVTTITYTAEDNAGNQGQCSFNVTLADNQAPVFTFCPPDHETYTTLMECSSIVNTLNPEVTDNCNELFSLTWEMTGATTGASPATGINYIGMYEFYAGVTTVIYTAADPGNNTATCEFTVTVTDNIDPIILTGPSGYNEANDPGSCWKEILTSNPVLFDNCQVESLTWSMTGATVASSPASGINYIGTYTFNVGTTIVTYVLTDVSGNTDQWLFAVIITDTEFPVLVCPFSEPQFRPADPGICSYTTQGIEFDPTHSDNCPGYNLSNNLTGGSTLTGYVFPIGTTNVVWIIADAEGNTLNCNFNVTVFDDEEPTVNGELEDITVEGCMAGDAPEAVTTVAGLEALGLSISDNCASDEDLAVTHEDVADGTCPITVTRTYTITDAYGNFAEVVQIIYIDDTTPPVITCPGGTPFTVTVNAGLTYVHDGTDWDATATDDCGLATLTAILTGATSSGPHNSLHGIVFNEGTTTVTWTAEDACGNTASCGFDVIVLGTADIAVEKVGSPEPVTPGDIITYEITITNNGPATAPEITLTDAVPAEVLDPGFSTDGGVTWNPWTGSWITNDLASGSHIEILIRGEVDCIVSELSNTAEVELGILTDPNPDNNTSTWTSTIDDPPPTFDIPDPPEFCVYEIFEALYDGQPEPDADITPDRPDWYIIDGTTELDLTNIHDNCCEPDEMIISWAIEFSDGLHPPVTGTGQPSGFGAITLWGTTDYTEIVHTITYVVEDCNGNPSEPVTVNITIRPRPNVIKQY